MKALLTGIILGVGVTIGLLGFAYEGILLGLGFFLGAIVTGVCLVEWK